MPLALTEHDLGRLMKDLGPRLLALSRGICRDTSAAEDVVQEAFVRLWNKPPDGPEQVVPSWLKRVVVNLSINHLRRRKNTETLPEFSDDPALRHEQRPEHQVDLADNMARLERAMGRLPDDKRAILVMKVFDEMSYDEIAATLEVPLGTVMSRLNRARAALRDEMEAELKHAEADPLIFPLRRKQG